MNKILPKKNESKFVFLIIIILALLILLPHFFGLTLQNEDRIYLGGKMFRTFDNLAYFSYIEQAREGFWGFYQLGLSIQQQPYFFHPLWLAIGKFALVTNLSNLAAFLISQLIFIIIFILLWYKFIKIFFDQPHEVKIVFIFSLTAGGFFTWLHETTTFLILYLNPMLILSLILFLSVVWLAYKYLTENHQIKYAWWSGVLCLLLLLNHFFDAVSLLVILGSFVLIAIFKKINLVQYIKYLLIVFLVTLPAIIYYLYLVIYIPAFGAAASANITRSPPITFYLVSFGLVLVLAILGTFRLLTRKTIKTKWLILIIWLGVQLCLLYAPVSFNRRLALGISLPMGLLAGYFFIYLWRLQTKLYLKQALKIFLIIGLLSGNVFLFTAEIIKISKYHFFISGDFYRSIIWLRQNTPRKTIVLADFKTCDTIISGFSGRFSLVTGGNATIDSWQYQFINDFYKDNINDDYKKDKLDQSGIDFVWYGHHERQIGSFQPNEKTYLKLVYQSGIEQVYQVVE